MQNHPVSLNTPVGTLAAESVLYHMFHVMTGLWSEGIEAGKKLTIGFWIQVEDLLNQATSPDGSGITNSPVLGVPAPLLRLALMLRRLYHYPTLKPKTPIEDIEGEVLVWESSLNDKCQAVESDYELADRYEQYCEDAISLHIIVVSLLFRQANSKVGELDRKKSGLPSEVAQDSWHLARAMQILKKYEADDRWAGCYIGTWPTYTLGFLVSTAKDRETVRADLQRRWHLTRLTQATRYATDLQMAWASRAAQGTESMPAPATCVSATSP
jgi:hypothetical protein